MMSDQTPLMLHSAAPMLMFLFILISLVPAGDGAAGGGAVQPHKSSSIVSSSNRPLPPPPHITVMGMVYCDICFNNSFSRHSYFLPGVNVRIDCKFKANSPRTSEQITFSVNRSTNRYGIYKLDLGSVDGVDCTRDKAIGVSCRATLLPSPKPEAAPPLSNCNVPGSTSTTSDEIAIKSTHSNTCIYGLTALNYRPPTKNPALCTPTPT